MHTGLCKLTKVHLKQQLSSCPQSFVNSFLPKVPFLPVLGILMPNSLRVYFCRSVSIFEHHRGPRQRNLCDFLIYYRFGG